MKSFTRRRIGLKFQLGEGTFGEEGFDTLDVAGLRCSAQIVKAGGVQQSTASLRVWGLSLDVMNRLSILGKQLLDARPNVVTITAGDDDTGASVAFQGNVYESWIDGRSAPETSLVMAAQTGYIMAMKPAQPTSYTGTVSVATIAAGIASQAGLAFENSGVDIQLVDPYLHGDLYSQLTDLRAQAGISIHIDGEKGGGTLAIWPRDGKRGGQVPLVSADTGLVGYPEVAQAGITLQTLYNPSINPGSSFKLKTALDRANGEWACFAVTHDLEAETPGGKWFSYVQAQLFGSTVPLAGGR